jgi:hypothetical protein
MQRESSEAGNGAGVLRRKRHREQKQIKGTPIGDKGEDRRSSTDKARVDRD